MLTLIELGTDGTAYFVVHISDSASDFSFHKVWKIVHDLVPPRKNIVCIPRPPWSSKKLGRMCGIVVVKLLPKSEGQAAKRR